MHEIFCQGVNKTRLKYLDSFGTEIAITSNDMQPLVELKIFTTFSADMKKLVLCCSIIRAHLLFKIHTRAPRILTVSTVTCNCSRCEQCVEHKESHIAYSFLESLCIRAAGYNSLKNLVYVDVFRKIQLNVILTVECTPRKDQQGIVKLVGKSPWNHLLWTAVQFPEDILAFYSKDNQLLGYQERDAIKDSLGNKVMHIKRESYTHKFGFEQQPSQYVRFAICDHTDSLVAMIGKNVNCVFVYRNSARVRRAQPSLLELAFAVPLAVKLSSSEYHMDEWPLPEITYHYKRVRQPGQGIF